MRYVVGPEGLFVIARFVALVGVRLRTYVLASTRNQIVRALAKRNASRKFYYLSRIVHANSPPSFWGLVKKIRMGLSYACPPVFMSGDDMVMDGNL